MKILVVGSGAREHALVYYLSKSSKLTNLYCAPGNGGTDEFAENVSIPSDDILALCEFVRTNKIELAVIGPERPLIAGLSDRLRKEGVLVFGPSSRAAMLEGSKAYSKQFMLDSGIPTSPAKIFIDPNIAKAYVKERSLLGARLVIKASGEALGKGAIVTDNLEDAMNAVEMMMLDGSCGDAGKTIVIEDRLFGDEISCMAICDKHSFQMLPLAKDYKRAFDSDKGPNTGGMGAYCTGKSFDKPLLKKLEKHIVKTTIDSLRKKSIDYQGVIYPGILIQDGEPFVLEYNCRFGDPEAQVILPLLKNDLLEICLATAQNSLSDIKLEWKQQVCVGVVIASGGYPARYQTGLPMSGIDEAKKIPGIKIFHGGTKKENNTILTTGGRVLTIVAKADNLVLARKNAYLACDLIKFQNSYCRKDIAKDLI